jgi:hypothetical protein
MVFCSSAFAQQITVHSRFMADSLKIGERVPVSVTARYPSTVNVLFPDSTFQFAPFEFESKSYFPTVTKDSTSYDSVVYYVSSFEIDSIQMLNIPVYMLAEGDCTTVFGSRDTIFLKHLVDNVPDSVEAQMLPLKTNTSYFNVDWLFNYPIYTAIGIFLFGAMLACYFIFAKHIRRYFTVRRLTRNHQRFLDRFTGAVDQLQSKFSALQAEAALLIWKQYMETLDNRPYTRYTSREISQLAHNEMLAKALKTIDRGIYGGYGSDVHLTFVDLRSYSEAHYSKKLEEVQNG